MTIIVTAFVIFVLLQALVSGVVAQDFLVPLSNSPINTSSGVSGSVQCTKNSDESYAVCGSLVNTPIKYNLRPFSFATKGPDQGQYMRSCDLYETSSQSTSRAVCVKGYDGTNGVVYFHNVSDMTVIANVTIGVTGNLPHVTVDTPSQIAYVNNYMNPPDIYKITNIGCSAPVVAATLSTFGSVDQNPAAMLIIDGFLYVHFYMNPARLARINISTFTWTQTVTFADGERFGGAGNLANDDDFIYDLTDDGIVVRCSYKNNNFLRSDSLSTGLSLTDGLAIAPDQRTLFVASNGNSVLQLVDVSSFSMFGKAANVPSALGRPIITSWCNVYAFGYFYDSIFAFRLNSSVCQTPSAVLSASTSGSSSNSASQNSATISLNPSASVSHLTVSSTATSSMSQSQLTPSNNATSSSSHSISAGDATSSTTLSHLTASGDATPSSSRDTPSKTADESTTKSLDLTPSSPNISVSSSSSITRIKSSSFLPSQSASAIVPPPPYISPLRDVYETTTATSSLASFASLSSTNVLGAARARSALSQFSDIVAGTCSLDFKSLSDLENNPPDRSSSPIRFKLNGSYLTGQAVGNLIVIFGVGAIWVFGLVAIHGRSKNINNKRQNHQTKKNKRKTDKKSFMQVVIASNAHETVLFTLMLLLGPTLTSSAMSLIGEMKVEGRTITVLSVVCVVLSWFVLLIIGLGFAMWKLIYARNFNHDVFEVNDEKEANDDDLNGGLGFRRFVEYTTSPFGEWKFAGRRKKEKILFELARPLIESFTNKCPKFIVIDVAVIILLSLAEVIPRMIPGESSACFLRGVTVCFILSLHVLLVLYYRSLYSDRMSNTVGCLVDSLSVLVVAGAMSIDENNVSQIKGWSRVAVAQAGLQMMMSALQVTEVLLPVWDGGVELVKKFCSSKKKDVTSKNATCHATDVSQLMNRDDRHDSFNSPLLQEMAVISQTENVSHRKISHTKQKRTI